MPHPGSPLVPARGYALPPGAGGAPARSAAARVGSARRPIARKTFLGLFCFTLLAAICLYDLNAVAATLFGIQQAFSYGIFALCLILLLVYRLTVFRDLGPTGRKYFLFMGVYLLISSPIGISGDAAGVYGRLMDIRYMVSSALIVAATAVAARHIYIAHNPRLILTIVFFLCTMISAWVLITDRYPALIYSSESVLSTGERAAGTYANPNGAGVAACLGAAVAFSALFVKGLRSFALPALLAAGAAVVVTFSRSSILILLGLALAQLFISPGIGKFIVFLVGGTLAAGVVLFIFRAASDTGAGLEQQRRMGTLASIFSGDISHETTGGRGQLAMNGLRAWLASPIIGNGLGSQRRIDQFTLGPHNTYIKVLGEGGIVPAFLFIFMVVSLFIAGWRCTTPAVRTLVCGYCLVLAMACFTSHGILMDREHNIMMGICFGLLAACSQLGSTQAVSQRQVSSAGALPPRTAATMSFRTTP